MKTDVLVVGGGLSGLALADQLTREGVDHLVVEAQDWLGGRILTRNLSGGAFDLGPAWFWPGQPRMAALADRFGIPVFEQFATGDLVYQDQSGAVQRGRGFASMQGSYRLEGGMGRLIEALGGVLAPENVWTNTRLTALAPRERGHTASILQHGLPRTIEARDVVLALPPRVIAETVSFEPALEEGLVADLRAIPTWMAGQAKILAVYDEPHWRMAGMSGDAMSHHGPMVEIHDASPVKGGPYALFGFVGVPAQVRAAHEAQLMDLARSQLVDLFGPAMAEPLDLVLQDWAKVPEIARSQDMTPAGGHPDYGLPAGLQTLGTGGLHFASTETAPTFGGFLEGALESAERTARAIRQRVPEGA
ncbi:FAD-dependent oxidoreductase [Labrenzia sp. VG12]|uniref:flavin monoamine oxidase family protein n=1 Tax=Labrenzia sp. VG12 TaxID=2021862 RepID=UPI000B8BEB5C|nr:FAD-dependent oxidoreductase [Labrenzia sp. VG12]ASP33594.1 amine oxidase [Labrenzia sp. VG12]